MELTTQQQLALRKATLLRRRAGEKRSMAMLRSGTGLGRKLLEESRWLYSEARRVLREAGLQVNF